MSVWRWWIFMCSTTSLRQGPFVWYCSANEDLCRGEPKQCW